jgi:hypothetical protein
MKNKFSFLGIVGLPLIVALVGYFIISGDEFGSLVLLGLLLMGFNRLLPPRSGR